MTNGKNSINTYPGRKMENDITHRREYAFVIIVFLFLFLVAGHPLRSCTFVSMARPGIVLAGCNEDYINLPTKIWFFPATAKAYGRMLWGYDRDFAPYQGA